MFFPIYMLINYVDLLELAKATSLVSLGSIQTLFLPHLRTAAASLFCNLRNAIFNIMY